MPLEVRRFRCLQTNYGHLLRDRATGTVAALDVPDAEAVLAQAQAAGWTVQLVINTHWHPDHTGGNAALQAATGAQIVGPEEVRRAAPLDRVVRPGETVTVGQITLTAIDTGGHTLGHLSFYAADAGQVFTGDALFPLGCGRMFEGTAAQFAAGLARLAALPPETQAWAGHEYGAGNARFALSVETDAEVRARLEAALARFEAGEASSPTTIGEERALNPFLRAAELRPGLAPAEAFAALRSAKDAFG
jgi:hydroxyacylglutathione hydrolase